MDIEELRQRLQGFEWNDFEVEEAGCEVPKAAYNAVSAFSNTGGGWLAFGVRQNGESFEVIGVADADKVQDSFLSALRTGRKLSRKIFPKESVIDDDGKRVLVFHIPESPRSDKPVYVGNNMSEAFTRRGGANHRCSDEELRRFLRDSDEERYEDKLVDEDVERCFDKRSLSWFRAECSRRDPGTSADLGDREFLEQWGLLSERDGSLYPTRAAILLFGTQGAVIRLLPRPVVDFQVIPASFETGSGDVRWIDRAVVEDNLVNAWLELRKRLFARAEIGFSIDPATLQRRDTPPNHVAIREATVNLLAHQDYGKRTGKASIRMFRDRTVFSNPGDSLAPAEDLLDADDRNVRNPRLVAAFRRIGLAEREGTGIGAIFENWRDLGRALPIISNDKESKRFDLALPREPLVGDRQVLIQAQLGVQLSDGEAATFATACRQPVLTLFDVRAATGLRESAARELAGRLESQALLEALGDRGPWRLAAHLKERIGSARADARADACADQASERATGIRGTSTKNQVGAYVGNLISDQVEVAEPSPVGRNGRERGLTGDQAGRSRGSLICDQVEAAGSSIVGRTGRERGLTRDQAGRPRGSLISDQVEAAESGTVGRTGRERGMTCDQAGRPRGSLIGDQAGGRSASPADRRGSARPGRLLLELSETQLRILGLCETPRSMKDLMAAIGVSHRANFGRQHLGPLLEAGLLKLRYPESPRHPRQGYVVADSALPLLGRKAGGDGE